MDIITTVTITTVRRPERGICWDIALFRGELRLPIGQVFTSDRRLTDRNKDTIETFVSAALELLVHDTIPQESLNPF